MGNMTVAIVKRSVGGGRRKVVADLTFSNSYATGGDTIVAADITKLLPEGHALTDLQEWHLTPRQSLGRHFQLDRTNKKILAFIDTGQVGAATDLSAEVVRATLEYGQVTGPE